MNSHSKSSGKSKSGSSLARQQKNLMKKQKEKIKYKNNLSLIEKTLSSSNNDLPSLIKELQELEEKFKPVNSKNTKDNKDNINIISNSLKKKHKLLKIKRLVYNAKEHFGFDKQITVNDVIDLLENNIITDSSAVINPKILQEINQANQLNQTNQLSQTNQLNQINLSNQSNQNQVNRTNPVNSTNPVFNINNMNLNYIPKETKPAFTIQDSYFSHFFSNMINNILKKNTQLQSQSAQIKDKTLNSGNTITDRIPTSKEVKMEMNNIANKHAAELSDKKENENSEEVILAQIKSLEEQIEKNEKLEKLKNDKNNKPNEQYDYLSRKKYRENKAKSLLNDPMDPFSVYANKKFENQDPKVLQQEYIKKLQEQQAKADIARRQFELSQPKKDTSVIKKEAQIYGCVETEKGEDLIPAIIKKKLMEGNPTQSLFSNTSNVGSLGNISNAGNVSKNNNNSSNYSNNNNNVITNNQNLNQSTNLTNSQFSNYAKKLDSINNNKLININNSSNEASDTKKSFGPAESTEEEIKKEFKKFMSEYKK